MSDDTKSAQNAVIPHRGPITVQIYEMERDNQPISAEQYDEAELRRLCRPTLPIRYVDRETFERL